MNTTPRPRRTVRSFVKRTGRLTPAQQRAMQELWPRYGVELSDKPLNLNEIFGRDADKVVEVGFGNGDSLVRMAAENPHFDFLGIEVHEPGIGHCLLQAAREGVENLRLINHDAVEIFAHHLPPASLSRVNLLFPDPWPKKRHHKRRILQPSFLGLLASALRKGGEVYIATDWRNYAEHVDEIMNSSDDFDVVARREHAGDEPLDRPMTKFEARGLRKGHRIWDWCYRRK